MKNTIVFSNCCSRRTSCKPEVHLSFVPYTNCMCSKLPVSTIEFRVGTLYRRLALEPVAFCLIKEPSNSLLLLLNSGPERYNK